MMLCISMITLPFTWAEWLKRTVSPSSYGYTGVTWISSTTVVAVGNNQLIGAVVFSHDAGLTWQYSNSSFGNLYDVASNTNVNGTILAVDDTGIVYLSKDYGYSWSQPATISASGGLYGVALGSSGVAYAVGALDRLYYSSTSSSFVTWTAITLTFTGTKAQLNGISTIDGVNVIAVGNRGYIFYTTSGMHLLFLYYSFLSIFLYRYLILEQDLLLRNVKYYLLCLPRFHQHCHRRWCLWLCSSDH